MRPKDPIVPSIVIRWATKRTRRWLHASLIYAAALMFILFIHIGRSGAIELHPGDILVVDKLFGSVIHIDPDTRDRTFVTTFNRGSGPGLISPTGISMDSNDQILVAGRVWLYRIEPETGNRTILSSFDVGTGPAFKRVFDVTVEQDGNILVSDPGRGALVRVDPDSGDRMIVSAAAQGPLCRGPKLPFPCCTGIRTGIDCDMAVGSGPEFRAPFGLTVEPDGEILVTDAALLAVFRVDPESGDREIISVADKSQECGFAEPACFSLRFPFSCCKGMGIGDGTAPCGNDDLAPFACCTGAESGDGSAPCSRVGSGPFFQGPLSIAMSREGEVIVTDVRQFFFQDAALLRVHLSSGDREVISSAEVGEGPMFRVLMQTAVDAEGRILVTDEGWRGVFEVDSDSGERSFFSVPDTTALCFAPGVPFPCCTGRSTGIGCDPGVGEGPSERSAQGLFVVPHDPCLGPKPDKHWKNHGEYVSDSVKRAQLWSKAGVIRKKGKGSFAHRAGRSDCGRR